MSIGINPPALPQPQRSPPSPAGMKSPTADLAQVSQMRPLLGLRKSLMQDELDNAFPLSMGPCVGLATRHRNPQATGFSLRTCVKDRYAGFQPVVCTVLLGCCPVNGQAPGRLDRVRGLYDHLEGALQQARQLKSRKIRCIREGFWVQVKDQPLDQGSSPATAASPWPKKANARRLTRVPKRDYK